MDISYTVSLKASSMEAQSLDKLQKLLLTLVGMFM